MEFFKDGKYIIGFLIGVICSFVVMGGIENYQQKHSAEEQVLGDELSVGEETSEASLDETVGTITSNSQKSSQTITKPEDPHSPELQRLALILKETEKMVERLKKEIRETEIKQQTATLLDQN